MFKNQTKILIFLIILVGLGVGGFFVYKNIFVPETEIEIPPEEKAEIPHVTEEELKKAEEEAPRVEEVPEVKKTPKVEEKPTVPNTPAMRDIDVSTTVGQLYTISWSVVSGVIKYDLERDTDPSFSNPGTVYFESSNSFAGTLSPSVSTTYYFRVKACNNYGCSSWSKTTMLWVEVPGAPKVYEKPSIEEKITVNSPNGGEIWGIGNTHTIFWESTVVTNGLTKVRINLLSQKKDDPSTYIVANIASEVDVTKGFYSWQIPAEMSCVSLPCLPLSDYPCHKIEFVDSRYGRDSQVSRKISDESNGCFKIIETIPNTPAMSDVNVSTTAGTPYKIGWANVSGATSYILERDTNSSFSDPSAVYSGSLSSFTGTLSPSVSTTYYFRVKACNNYGCSSWSKTTMLWVEVIVPSITVTSPNGGERWIVGNTYEITWTAVGVSKVTLYVNYGGGYLGLGTTIPSIGVDATLGKFSWQIPSNLPYAPGDNLKIKIINDSDSTVYDESDNYFSIIEP